MKTTYNISKPIKLTILLTLFCLIVCARKINNNKKTVLLGIGGDTMLGRLVNVVINKKGYDYPWGNLLPLLQKSDINLVNLENSFTKSEKRVPKVFNFKSDPKNVHALLNAHINIVNLANNHSLDFHKKGLIDTIATLNKAGIKHVGAGRNIKDAQKAVIIKKNNLTIGFIGLTDNEARWLATENKPGINYIPVGDIEKIKPIIQNLRNKVDIIVASIHWGPNMRSKPTEKFINFAHQLVEAGVDIIHGHSAHIFQGIELYNKSALILYDTGDFVDDYAVDPKLRNDQSFFYQIIIDKSGIKQIQLIPTLIENMQVNKATGTNYKEIINRIQKLSAPFGTKISNTGVITMKQK